MFNYLLSERGRERSGLGFWWWWREVDERGREGGSRESERHREREASLEIRRKLFPTRGISPIFPHAYAANLMIIGSRNCVIQ